MSARKLKWSSLLHLTELEFIPDSPRMLDVSDELVQCLSWLTGATNHDRRLIRCNEVGSILVGNAWDNLVEVETYQLYPESASPKTFTAGVLNKGVLIATSTELVMIYFYRIDSADYEKVFLPPNWLYFYPYKVFKVIAATVPATGGTASYVGLTAFN